MEKRVVSYAFINNTLGLVFGLASVAAICYLCYYAFGKGYPGSAATIAVGVMATLAGVFVFRKYKKE